MLLAGSLSALAHDVPAEVAKSPPAGAFKAVSGLVKLPDFLPGMGQLFVDPATLPAGPFLAYDHDGALVSTDLHAADQGSQSRQAASTTSRRRAAMSTMSTSTTMPAIRASKSRMSMSCSGMFRRPTKRGSPNDPDAQARSWRPAGDPRRPLPARPARAADGESSRSPMRGEADGSHVWFDPIGVHLKPGQTVRWTNRDPGNSHTVDGLPSRQYSSGRCAFPAGARPGIRTICCRTKPFP